MRDAVGRALLHWRTRVVLPLVWGRLLDVACGLNRLVRSYHGEGTGVDVHQWGDVDLVVGDCAHLPYEDGAFQTVTILAALNHIPNREEVLAECFRILERGGTILITMLSPRVSELWHMVRGSADADQAERGMVEGEVFGLTPVEVERLLSSARFEVVRRKRFMLGLNCLTVARKPGPGDVSCSG